MVPLTTLWLPILLSAVIVFGDAGEIQTRTGRSTNRVSKRRTGNGKISGEMVPLLFTGEHLCRLFDWPDESAGSELFGSISNCRNCWIHGIWYGADPGCHLEG